MGTEMEAKSTGWRVTVPAGTYFLGDPCYAVPDEDWYPLLEDSDFFRKCVGEISGYRVMAFNTKYGDGAYFDQEGTRYPVDAGLIGLTPKDYATGLSDYPDVPGRIVTFDTDVIAHTDGSGLLVFGDIEIDTDPEDDVPEDELRWDDDEDYDDDDEETWEAWGLNDE